MSDQAPIRPRHLFYTQSSRVAIDPATGDTLVLDDQPQLPDLDRGDAVGRFVLLDRIGAGGGGVVYSAYDPDLDRKIALKLVHAASGKEPSPDGISPTGLRMIREAQALARLNHPNVISVYDVGTIGHEVFLAEEFVDGWCLSDWLEEEPRNQKEVLAAFWQAGQGLAAAHAADLIHRDFKPDNLLIGRDGRVRVVDFGLAQAATDEVVGASAELARMLARGEKELSYSPDSRLTMTGQVVGTPAFMAPEQFQNGAVDARTDQFAFCVSLYIALYGEGPFPTDRLLELVTAVNEGAVREPPKGTRVPSWLRRVLLRGLSVNPDERYPSMNDLLHDLARDPKTVSRRWLGAVGVMVLVAGLVVGQLYSNSRETELCAGAQEKLQGIWDAERKAAILAAFLSTGGSYTEDAWRGVADTLDNYTSEWVRTYTDACRATHVHGEQSTELLDRSMLCLSHRLNEVQALSGILSQADERVVQKAVSAAHDLSPIAPCGDAKLLMSRVTPPQDEPTRVGTEKVRTRLAEGAALLQTGRYGEGIEVVQKAATEAEALSYRPVQAEAWYQLGVLQTAAGKYFVAEKSLQRALQASIASGDDSLEASVAIQMVFTVGNRLARHREGHTLGRHAAAVVERLGGDQALQADWHGVMGRLADGEGKYDEAVSQFEKQLTLWETMRGAKSLKVADSLTSLAAAYFVTGKNRAALKHYRAALAIRKEVLGIEHPVTAFALNTIGLIYSNLGDYTTAISKTRRALDLIEKSVGKSHPGWAGCIENLAIINASRGSYDEAMRYYDETLTLYEGFYGPGHRYVARLLNGMGAALLRLGEPQKAQRHHERALANLEATFGVDYPQLDMARTFVHLGNLAQHQRQSGQAAENYARGLRLFKAVVGNEHPYLLPALVGLGETSLVRRAPGPARDWLEQAWAIDKNPEIGHGFLGAVDATLEARLRFALARALVSAGGQKHRAVGLAREALDELTTGPERDGQRQAVLSWLARNDG